MATTPTKIDEVKPADNRPALITEKMLAHDFAHLLADAETLISAGDEVPPVIEDEEDLALAREAVKNLVAKAKAVDATREDIKRPYIDAERVAQSFFKKLETRMTDKVAAISKVAKVYLDRKEKEERDRREAEQRKREAEERQRQEAEAEARRVAEAARVAEENRQRTLREAEERRQREAREVEERRQIEAQAELDRLAKEAQDTKDAERREQLERETGERRVRDENDRLAREARELQENKARALQEAKERESREAEQRRLDDEARQRAAETDRATASRLAAENAAAAKPADLARTRLGSGMATLRQEWDFEITDFANVDLGALRAFIPKADIEKAIRRHVAINKDQVPIAGVRIFDKTKTQWS